MSKRPSLSAFAPQPLQADGGKVAAITAPSIAASKPQRPTSVTVYLTPEEVRALKLIGIEHDMKLTDICATAVREWMERNGHMRGKMFKA
jgi:hypothetical protein